MGGWLWWMMNWETSGLWQAFYHSPGETTENDDDISESRIEPVISVLQSFVLRLPKHTRKNWGRTRQTWIEISKSWIWWHGITDRQTIRRCALPDCGPRRSLNWTRYDGAPCKPRATNFVISNLHPHSKLNDSRNWNDCIISTLKDT
jgi:hypothetical protein